MNEMSLNGTMAVNGCLRYLLRNDPDALLLGEDIGIYGGAFGVTRGLLDEFGARRVIDTPISEASFVGAAAGMAMCGLRPVVEIMFMDFITLAFDQMLNHASKYKFMFDGQYDVSMIVRTPSGAGRAYGPSHSQTLGSLFAHIPGVDVVAPSTPLDVIGLYKTAFQCTRPVIFMENKFLYNETEFVDSVNPDVLIEASEMIPFGKCRVARSGEHVSIITWGGLVRAALSVAEELEAEGVSVEVIDIRTLSPLDSDGILASVRKTGRMVVCGEEYPMCSISSEIISSLSCVAPEILKAPAKRVDLMPMPIPSGKEVESFVLPTAERIKSAIADVCGMSL
ncbi:MAG: transketolase C-terminal domain-containing protein [Kiritimatiellia bacterium]